MTDTQKPKPHAAHGSSEQVRALPTDAELEKSFCVWHDTFLLRNGYVPSLEETCHWMRDTYAKPLIEELSLANKDFQEVRDSMMNVESERQQLNKEFEVQKTLLRMRDKQLRIMREQLALAVEALKEAWGNNRNPNIYIVMDAAKEALEKIKDLEKK